jgi:type II secretory pathway predicted ATPase ExeA
VKFQALDLNPQPLTAGPMRSFRHESYAAAARTVLEATKLGPGFVLLTGASGTGKTTLIHDLAEQLERDGYCVGRVATSSVDADDLLRLASFAFGLRAHSIPQARLLSGLADRLRSICPAGESAVLIIDEAQELAPGALPELCQLVGLPGAKAPPVHILLSGRDRVWELLDRPDHGPIRQHIIASCRLYPLSLEETRSYVAHSLEAAGWRGEPGISADAVRLVHARTGGVPRLITLTLGHLLLHGRHCGARLLESQDVETVVAHLEKDHPELLLEPLGTRSLADNVLAQAFATPELQRPPTSGEDESSADQRQGSRRKDLPGENLSPSAERKPRGPARGFWKWTLTGVAAAALVAYLFGSDEADETQDIPEPTTAAEIASESTAEMESLNASPVTALMPQDLGISSSPGDGAAAEGTHLASVEPSAQLSEPLEAGGTPADSLAGAPEGGAAMQSEMDETMSEVDVGNASPEQQATPSPEVSQLLEKAELALSNNRLMVPADDNAYAYYREVLAIDPANDQAETGLQRIVTGYRELAEQSLKKGNRAEAKRYASRGLTLAPGDQRLLTIQRQSSKPRAIKRQASKPRARKPQREASQATAPKQDEEAPQFLDRVEAWLRSGSTDTSHFLDQDL